MPNESEGIQKRLQVMSERFEKTVDVEEIEHIAEQAKELLPAQKPLNINGCSDKECSRPVIAVAFVYLLAHLALQDLSVCFLYEYLSDPGNIQVRLSLIPLLSEVL